jgi:hypothetical protein
MPESEHISESAYLVTNDKRFSIGGPSQCDGIPKTFDFIDNRFSSDIPELNIPIAADTTELGIFNRVEGYLFNSSSMTFKIC